MVESLPIAFVVSSKHILSDKLSEELLRKNCRVIRISSLADFKKHISSSKYSPSYVFIIQGFLGPTDFLPSEKFKDLFKFIESNKCKSQIVLPYNTANFYSKESFLVTGFKKIRNVRKSIVYLGEIIEMPGSLGNKLVRAIQEKGRILLGNYNFNIYLIFCEDACRILLKEIFSYGFLKDEIVVAYRDTMAGFAKKIKNLFPDLPFYRDRTLTPSSTVSDFDFIEVAFDEKKFKRIIGNPNVKKKIREPKKIVLPKIVIPKIILPRLVFPRKLFVIVIFLLWVVSLPLLSFVASSFFLRQGFVVVGYNDGLANLYFNISKTTALLSGTVLRNFGEPGRLATLVGDWADVGLTSVNALKLGRSFAAKINGDGDYDVGVYSSNLYLMVDDLYKKISFLEADRKSFVDVNFFVPNNFDFKSVASFLSSFKEVVKTLPSVLGEDGKKTYLVLVTNKNIVRPSGGKIESLEVVAFDKGRLVDKNLYNISEVDKQLRGHADPPLPLARYLGITNWSLGESNWDSDFSSSAPRSEWFLKSELGITADGTVSMDMGVFEKLGNLKNSNFLENIGTIFRLLDEQNIQVFSDDEFLQKELGNLRWDGGVHFPTCSGNCVSVGGGVVEANLGGTKMGENITRSMNMNVSFKNGVVQNSLEVNYTNISKESYKNYVRVLAPLGAEFGDVTGKVGGKNIRFVTDVNKYSNRVEAGVWVEIPSGSTKLTFTWTQKESVNFLGSGRLLFYLRGQPGVGSVPVEVSFDFPSTLTNKLVSRYNTVLTGELVREFDW